jgi:hypothetical protein
MMLYRTMRAAADGLPEIPAKGESAVPESNQLGVRYGKPPRDIHIDDQGQVDPERYPDGGQGLSTFRDDPMRLPAQRRPTSFKGGFCEDPLYAIASEEVLSIPGLRLFFKEKGYHVGVGPSGLAPFEIYRACLEETRGYWKRQ